jgi:hypothetical protein
MLRTILKRVGRVRKRMGYTGMQLRGMISLQPSGQWRYFKRSIFFVSLNSLALPPETWWACRL